MEMTTDLIDDFERVISPQTQIVVHYSGLDQKVKKFLDSRPQVIVKNKLEMSNFLIMIT